MRLTFSFLIIPIAMATSFVGCGLRGDLYMPGEPEQPAAIITNDEELAVDVETQAEDPEDLAEDEAKREAGEQQ